MINQSHNRHKPCQNNNSEKLSETEIMMIANLFAAMTSADEAILDIEHFVATAFLEEYDSDYCDLIYETYHDAVTNNTQQEIIENIQGLVCSFSENQKLRIFRSLSAIAGCDGVVHPKEEALIKIFKEAMGLEDTSINIANEKERNKFVDLNPLPH